MDVWIHGYTSICFSGMGESEAAGMDRDVFDGAGVARKAA